MDLTEVSHNINLAKLDNARWLKYASELIEGSSVSKEGIPTYRDECTPCQWLYDHSDEVSQLYQKIDKSEINLFHFDIMEQIEILRYDLHENYLQIFKTYLRELNNSFFSHLFHLKKKVSDYEKIDAKRHLNEMKRVVEELNLMLDHLEQSLYQMCELNSA